MGKIFSWIFPNKEQWLFQKFDFFQLQKKHCTFFRVGGSMYEHNVDDKGFQLLSYHDLSIFMSANAEGLHRVNEEFDVANMCAVKKKL
jgi:hypothetical protein